MSAEKTTKSCSFCWRRRKKRDDHDDEDHNTTRASRSSGPDNNAIRLTFNQLQIATNDFSNMIGEGGFGKVYRGTFDGQEIAVKRLNRDGLQGSQEFKAEALMLMKLHHPNIVKLVGYCVERDERLLAYEFVCNGSLANHLHEKGKGVFLDWKTRMKIASGAANGLKYLHCLARPVIYRDMKPANLLLDSSFNTVLSDFGVARNGPTGDQTHVSTRVIGSFGYIAPEYYATGRLTTRSDIYNFGILLIELVSGRRAYEENLATWSCNLAKDERYMDIIDPVLRKQAPWKQVRALTGMTSLMVQEAKHRPNITFVARRLKRLATDKASSSSAAAAASSSAAAGASSSYAGGASSSYAGGASSSSTTAPSKTSSSSQKAHWLFKCI